jgi:hypothetical protein
MLLNNRGCFGDLSTCFDQLALATVLGVLYCLGPISAKDFRAEKRGLKQIPWNLKT